MSNYSPRSFGRRSSREVIAPSFLSKSLLCIALAAEAQAPATDATAASGDIIVTARNKAESLQDVALTITTWSGAVLAERGSKTLRNIARAPS